MTLVSDKRASASKPGPEAQPGLPQEVEFILSAIEAGEFCGKSRRNSARRPYRIAASLKLFSDDLDVSAWTLYVRDINAQGLGFVTRHRLPLGYGGILTIAGPDQKLVRIDCTLLRCREAVQGWFEGSMYFNREQSLFAMPVSKRK
jgi:hypothetical protein